MNGKRRIKIALLIIVLLLLVVVTGPTFGLVYHMTRQMHAGQRYMDSLTEVEIQKWIERSKNYLAEANSNEHPDSNPPVPPDLKALKIVRIDLHSNSVVYLWCGGLDHTYMKVNERDGSYEVIAGYDDDHSKVIWPMKNASKLLQPTATPPSISAKP